MSSGTAAKCTEYKHLSGRLFCGFVMRLRGASQSFSCTAQVIWHVFVLLWRAEWRLHTVLCKPQVTVCGCYTPCKSAAAATEVFWQVRFSLARGLGETAIRYTGPTRGQGCKTCPESHEVQQNTWRYTPELLNRGKNEVTKEDWIIWTKYGRICVASLS